MIDSHYFVLFYGGSPRFVTWEKTCAPVRNIEEHWLTRLKIKAKAWFDDLPEFISTARIETRHI